MQLAAAIALAVLYAGLTLAWGGARPGTGSPWWVFAPFIVTFGAAGLAWATSATLPAPWRHKRPYGLPPRRVHLSWRAALRLPVLAPMFVFLYYLDRGLSLHFDVRWTVVVAAALAAMAAGFIGWRRRREFRLLRDGEVALGVVDDRNDIGEGPDRIAYHFTTAEGTPVSGRGWDVGYGVSPGSPVPVFYDAGDPGDHVVACGCWLEAD